MRQLLEHYIDEAIKLELNISRLYFRFYQLFPEDKDFWWRLAAEEKNHASLLKNLKLAIPLVGNPPAELLALKTDDLRVTNERIDNMVKTYAGHESRRRALEHALELEESAGELHYQSFIESQDLSKEYKIFQHLNLEDKDHALRIRRYIADHNL